MFKGNQPNTYDEIVNKTTDENLTSEVLEHILNLCHKAQDEGLEAAHNAIAGVLQRPAHSPNVQLHALSALLKNFELHRKMALRAFTQGLENLIIDRTTCEQVGRKSLESIAASTARFENDSIRGNVEECYNKFDAAQETPPVVDDEVRRREEEELSEIWDKGGTNQWGKRFATSSCHVGGPRSSCCKRAEASASGSSSMPASESVTESTAARGFTVVTRVRALRSFESTEPGHLAIEKGDIITVVDHGRQGWWGCESWWRGQLKGRTGIFPVDYVEPESECVTGLTAAWGITVVTEVRALYSWQPTKPGDLAFEKGDIIKVVDRGYAGWWGSEGWWRGQLKGRTGIFPVNYVEPASESATELAAPGGITAVTRVRALYSFEAMNPGDLAFEKGDIIQVVDRGYEFWWGSEGWWHGQLKGRTGVFPVNYVEPVAEPTAAELAPTLTPLPRRQTPVAVPTPETTMLTPPAATGSASKSVTELASAGGIPVVTAVENLSDWLVIGPGTSDLSIGFAEED